MSEEGKKNGATPPPAEKRDNKSNMPGPGRVVRIPGSLIFCDGKRKLREKRRR